MPPITPATPATPVTTISRFENKEEPSNTPTPAPSASIPMGTLIKFDTVGENFYQKAKALYECLGREPRHAQLEGAYVEMGLALKALEDSKQ